MKKTLKVFALLSLFLFIVAPAHAAGFAQESAPINSDQVLLAVLYVFAVLASLPGVALFSSAVTNALKNICGLFGVNFNGQSDQVAAWLNLAVFFFLVYFRVFQPAVSFEVIDDKFKLIAEALTALSFLFGQLKLQPIVYSALKGKLPFFGTSYTK